jgi:ribose-phosphate pyrophosphokinase
MRVRDLMTRDVETTTPDTTVQSAAALMRAVGVGFLPVLEGQRLVGVLTDRDIVVRATAEGTDASKLRVADIMTPQVRYCFDDQSADEAEELMDDREVGRLVVVDHKKRMVGVLSIDDLAGAVHEPLAIVAGSAHPQLAAALAAELGHPLAAYAPERFPDGELSVELGVEVRGRHAVLVQPMTSPGGERLLELLLMADACRRIGARAVYAVVPYVGYARQDHRTRGTQSLGMHVVGDLLARGRFDRVIAVDLHASAIEGFVDVPMDPLTAVPRLAKALRPHVGEGWVVVSPDLGAVKLAREYARILELPMAIVHKTRTGGAEVRAEQVIGDVRGKRPVVVDDMITTGGTIEAAANALRERGSAPELMVAATHPLLVGPAIERLSRVGLQRLVTSDSVPAPSGVPFALEIVSLAPTLADAVRRACAAK